MARTLQLACPAKLEVQGDETVLVSFPDIRGALTEGSTRVEALAEAADCLVAVLSGYVNDRRDSNPVTGAAGQTCAY